MQNKFFILILLFFLICPIVNAAEGYKGTGYKSNAGYSSKGKGYNGNTGYSNIEKGYNKTDQNFIIDQNKLNKEIQKSMQADPQLIEKSRQEAQQYVNQHPELILQFQNMVEKQMGK